MSKVVGIKADLVRSAEHSDHSTVVTVLGSTGWGPRNLKSRFQRCEVWDVVSCHLGCWFDGSRVFSVTFSHAIELRL